jgi:23S rRNA pseudouridine1911/1915/1917 synthase
MISIIFKNNNLVVIDKPIGMPTQSDTSGDPDAMSETSACLKNAGEPSELWLVHRLDRVVGGLVIFARNKKTAAMLSEMVGGRGMNKEYFAVVSGNAVGGIMEDYLYKDSIKGKAFVVSGARKGSKKATLEYELVECAETERGVYSLVKIKLHTGRFHQIRAQFSSRGLPLVGDGKYGSRDNRAKTPALFAKGLNFLLDGDPISVCGLPDINEYPWSLFNKECYYD